MYMCTCIYISVFISYETRGGFVFDLYQLFSYCCEMAAVDDHCVLKCSGRIYLVFTGFIL